MVGGTWILTQCPEPETCQANTHNGQAPRTLGEQGGTPVPPSLPILSFISSPLLPWPSPAPIHPHWPEHRHVGLDTFNGRMLRTRRPFPGLGGAVWGGMSTFRCPVMTIPPPQPGPSGSSSPGVLPSSSLPSPNTPGPEFQINLTDTNACTQLYALMRTHSDVHEEGQACAETHRQSLGGKQTHWTSLKNTGPHSQTHGFGEREVQREPAAQRATIVHPEMTATNAPICTERDTPSHCHGHVHGARTPRASSHTCTQTRVMHTYRGTRARTRLGNLYRDAR